MRKALPDIAKDAHQAEMSNKTPVKQDTRLCGYATDQEFPFS
jgi:hypothetical protein